MLLKDTLYQQRQPRTPQAAYHDFQHTAEDTNSASHLKAPHAKENKDLGKPSLWKMKFLDPSTFPSPRRWEGDKWIQDTRTTNSVSSVFLFKTVFKDIKKSRDIHNPSSYQQKQLALAVTHIFSILQNLNLKIKQKGPVLNRTICHTVTSTDLWFKRDLTDNFKALSYFSKEITDGLGQQQTNGFTQSSANAPSWDSQHNQWPTITRYAAES